MPKKNADSKKMLFLCTYCSVTGLHNKIHFLSLLLHIFRSCLFWGLHRQSTTRQTKHMELRLNPKMVIDPDETIVSQFSLCSHVPSHSPCCCTCRSSSVPYGIITGKIRSLLLIHFHLDSHRSWLQTIFTEMLPDLSHLCPWTFYCPHRSSILLKNHVHS